MAKKQRRWNKPKIRAVVTGSEGFIGTYLQTALEMSRRFWVAKVDLKRGLDLKQFETLPAVRWLKRFKPQVIFHLASWIDMNESMVDPLKYLDNITMTEALLNACQQLLSPPRIIFTSSCAVYGTRTYKRPICESDALEPRTYYGFTKVMCEKLIAQYRNHVIFRLGNVYGQGSKAYVQQIPKLETPTRFLGDIVRDFVHVDDVVNALIAASEKRKSGTFNLGTGYGTSYRKVLEHFFPPNKVFHYITKPNYIPTWTVLDVQNLRAFLGWVPQRFSFERLEKEL